MIIFFWLTKASFGTVLLFLIMLPPAATVQLSFIVTCECAIFWLPQAPIIGSVCRDLIILPTTQPISMLRGVMRIIYLTAIPALLVAGLPIEAITYRHPLHLIGIAYGVSLAWLALSVWVLNKSVHRYESGNVIG
jgi:ABC-type uncharacterized transport system permease subunit